MTLGEAIAVDPFFARVEIDDNGCWVWMARRDKDGYGRINRGPGARPELTHRYAYAKFVREIPDDYTIDHLCRNRACCNPAHLEAVTREENYRRAIAARTRCPNGHAYTPENTGTSHGRRTCLECGRRRSRRYAARKRRAAAEGTQT